MGSLWSRLFQPYHKAYELICFVTNHSHAFYVHADTVPAVISIPSVTSHPSQGTKGPRHGSSSEEFESEDEYVPIGNLGMGWIQIQADKWMEGRLMENRFMVGLWNPFRKY